MHAGGDATRRPLVNKKLYCQSQQYCDDMRSCITLDQLALVSLRYSGLTDAITAYLGSVEEVPCLPVDILHFVSAGARAKIAASCTQGDDGRFNKQREKFISSNSIGSNFCQSVSTTPVRNLLPKQEMKSDGAFTKQTITRIGPNPA